MSEKGVLQLTAGRTPFMHVLKLFFALSFLFFTLVTEEDKKTCFNAERNYSYQQTACRALVCWSKYTTHILTLFMFWIYPKLQTPAYFLHY